MVIGIRVEAENIQTGVVKHCNSSYFTMVAKDKDGKNVQVPTLKLVSDDELRHFYKAIQQKLNLTVAVSDADLPLFIKGALSVYVENTASLTKVADAAPKQSFQEYTTTPSQTNKSDAVNSALGMLTALNNQDRGLFK